MAKLKLKKNVRNMIYKILIVIILVFVVCFSFKTINNMIKQKNAIETKLSNIGYTENEIKVFKEYLSDEELDTLINEEKKPYLCTFLTEKYYLKKNLDAYSAYKALHPEISYTDVVALVNTNAYIEPYTNIIDSDPSKNNLILVNKYHKLPEGFLPTTVLSSNWYAYGENYLTEETYNAFKEMFNAAKAQDLTIVISSGYRSYDKQESIYNYDENLYGIAQTDKMVARPGHSEHQTGLAVDVLAPGFNLDTFETSPAYTWLINNAHNYGFILRYPSDKENITGYSFESWHYRYVGKEVALKIYNEKITFDEYYAYYIAK